MAPITLLDGRDLPEVQRKRGQLYLAAFCALGLCFQVTASNRPQSDGVLDGFFPLVGLLAVTTGALALLLLRRSRVTAAPHTWARTQPFRDLTSPHDRSRRASHGGWRVATVHLLRRDLAHSAFTLLFLIASFVEKRLVPVTRHILASSLSFLHSRAQRWCSERWFSDSGPIEDSDNAMENLASWRSTRLRRPAAVQTDVPNLSQTESEATKAPPEPAGPVPAPLPKRDPWSKALADFEERSERGTRRNR